MLLRKSLLTLPLLSLIVACGNQASTSDVQTKPVHQDAGHREVITVEVSEIETPTEVDRILAANKFDASTLSPSGMYEREPVARPENALEIINIGKEIWTIIEKNKPIANISRDYASAVPEGVKSFAELAGFSDIQKKSYEWVGKNLLGRKIFIIRYTLVYQYGASHQGKGKYLASVGILPTLVNVEWGWTVDFTVKSASVTNVGSAEDPVGSVALDLLMAAKSPVSNVTVGKLFQVRGDNGKVIVVE